jgi:glycosyltransferase 2 family protein
MKSFLNRYGIILVVLLIMATGYFMDVTMADILSTFGQLSVQEIIWLVLFAGIVMFADAVMRIYLLNNLGYRLPMNKVVLIHFASLSAHYATPAKIGFPVMAVLFKKFCQVKFTDTAMMIMFGILISLGMSGILALVGSIFYFSQNLNNIIIALSVGGILTVIGVLILRKLSSRWIKLSRIINSLQEAVKMLTTSVITAYSIMRLVSIVLQGTLFSLMVNFMGGSIGIFEATIATSTSYFLGAISMVPMGLGVSEATLGFFLSKLGLDQGVILSVLILQRVFSTVLGFIIGLISSAILGVKSITELKNPDE